MASWATVADVLAVTGTAAVPAGVASAQSVVEVFAGVTAGSTGLSVRNLRLLNRAVCFQTVWMATQVDVLSRVEVKAITQDQATVTPASRDALLLAPLAHRCLAQLSWRRASSVRVRTEAARPTYAAVTAVQAAFLRDQRPESWSAL